jgi:ABC-2 type transport system permease protein
MNKIWLIIKREYITRVRNKTFLLSTFLLPFMIVLFIAGSVFLAAKAEEKHKTIAFSDASDIFKPLLKTDSSSKLGFVFEPGTDTLNYTAKGFDGFVYLDDSINHHFILRTPKAASIGTISSIENKLNEAYQNYQLQQSGISRAYLDSIKKASSGYFNVDNKGDDDKIVNAGINYAVGFGSGILIYITMFIFGAMVMRGVMEEKTSRIAEVMVSSVKPFQLMLGKILGIGAVGLTQLLLWIILMSGTANTK